MNGRSDDGYNNAVLAGFSALLKWHLFENGTRPGGASGNRGTMWHKKDFAVACYGKTADVALAVRNVENWIRDRKPVRPHNLQMLESALFGDAENDPYDIWSKDFRTAWHLAGKKESPPVPELETFPGTAKSASSTAQLDTQPAAPARRTGPMMAPAPPADFVQRPAEFDALKLRLLDTRGNAVAITAALKGAGGYGKTTLARGLAHDPHIQDAYPDGILWVELGEKPINVISIVSDLIEILTGERPGLENLNMAVSKLGEALGDRRILLVVDDVWRAEDLPPFLQGGPHTTRLVTTRNDDALPPEAFRQTVDAMQKSEAVTLLGTGLPKDQATQQTYAITHLAVRLGEWPLLLRLVNGFLRDRVVKGGAGLAGAIAGVNERLDAKGFVVFDAKNPAERTSAVARTIEVSLDFLDETSKVTAARTRFSELAVFPEDADVPIEIVVRLWKQTGGLDKLDTEDLLSHLSHLSLLLSLDLDHHTFRFHDTVRQFLRERAGSNAISVLNKTLNRAMNDLGSTDINGTSRRYYYLYLARHLAEAGDRAALNALLTNPAWLNGKFHALNSIHELIGDYEKFGKGHFQILLKRTLRLISGTVERDKRQLLSQLLVRLAPNVHPEAALFLAAARKLIHAPAFVPESATLPPAGAERIRLDGHTHGVTSLVSFKDGRLASSGEDTTIRIWDLDNAKELQRLEGHTEQINSLIVLPTGRLASAAGSDTRPYSDYAIRIWDVDTGMLVARLEGHTKPVNAFAVLPDGHLASASACTLHLWDIETREQVACLEGHAGLITTLALLADSHLASGSDDGSIRIWDLRKPKAITSTQLEHGEGVKALVVLPNGILISVADHGLKLWNVADGILVDELKDIRPVDLIDYAFTALPDGRIVWGAGYTIIVQEAKRKANRAYLRGNISKVSALAVLPDGRLASGARDGTVRIWNPDESSQNYFNKTGHLSEVMALVALSGNRLASASRDSTVRLWDVGRKAEVLQLSGESCDGFRALTKITDGRIATGSQDGTIRVWTVRSGHGLTYGFEKLRFNNGFDKAYSVDEQRRGVSALATLPDGRLASGSVDSIIRIWDLKRTRKSERNKESGRLKGHTQLVAALTVLPEGRLASGSWDGTVRLWNIETETETMCLEDTNRGWVMALAVLPDGRLASGGVDRPITLWNVQAGVKTDQLAISASALCVLANGRLVSGFWDRIVRLWDTELRLELCRIELDAPVQSLVALPTGGVVAGDAVGRVHWLSIVDSKFVHAQREEFRALGCTDDEIKDIIVRELSKPQPHAAATSTTGVAGQSGMSGVLNKLNVAMSLVTGFLPSVATGIVDLLGRDNLHVWSRAGIFLAATLALVVVIGLTIYQQHQQHIPPVGLLVLAALYRISGVLWFLWLGLGCLGKRGKVIIMAIDSNPALSWILGALWAFGPIALTVKWLLGYE